MYCIIQFVEKTNVFIVIEQYIISNHKTTKIYVSWLNEFVFRKSQLQLRIIILIVFTGARILALKAQDEMKNK